MRRLRDDGPTGAVSVTSTQRDQAPSDVVQDDRFDFGQAASGQGKMHLIDFDSDSALLVAHDYDDRAVCGSITAFQQVAADAADDLQGEPSKWCYGCINTAFSRGVISAAAPFGYVDHDGEAVKPEHLPDDAAAASGGDADR